MNVLESLTREHGVFALLLDRLETVAGGEEATARRDARNMLLVLLSALDEHERLEELVFGQPGYAARPDARLLIELVEDQHRQIQELRLELLDAGAASVAVPIPRLRFLIGRIAECLREHFRTEEETLWPHFEDFHRSQDAEPRRRLERAVAALESEIEANSAAMTDYLSSKNPH